MKKIILTLTVLAFAMQGFSHDLMFDDFLKQHEVVGPKLEKMVCDMEDLAHQIMTSNDLEQQNALAEEIRSIGKSLKNDIKVLREKNSVECDNYLTGYAVALAVGNVALTPLYAGLYSTDELPKSKYYNFVDEMVHLAWRVEVAKSPEKALEKSEDLLEVISEYNLYHAE